MSMLKWPAPFEEVDLLRRELDYLLNPQAATPGVGFSPPVEVVEAEGEYRLRVSLPGLPTNNLGEHVQIDATPKTVTLSGEIRPPALRAGEKTLISQARYGKFYKQLSFPDGVEPERIEASYGAGMLEIILPKASASQKKSVQIQVK